MATDGSSAGDGGTSEDEEEVVAAVLGDYLAVGGYRDMFSGLLMTMVWSVMLLH